MTTSPMFSSQAEVIAWQRGYAAAQAAASQAVCGDARVYAGVMRYCTKHEGHAGDHWDGRVEGVQWRDLLPGDPAFVPTPVPSAPERVDAAVRYLRDLADALDEARETLPAGFSYAAEDEAIALRRVAAGFEARAAIMRAVAGVATS